MEPVTLVAIRIVILAAALWLGLTAAQYVMRGFTRVKA